MRQAEGNNLCSYYVCEFIHDFTGSKKMCTYQINNNFLHLITDMYDFKIIVSVRDSFGK
jgi:hypothetical protein